MGKPSAGPVDVIELQAQVGDAGDHGPGGGIMRAEDGNQVVGADSGDVGLQVGEPANK